MVCTTPKKALATRSPYSLPKYMFLDLPRDVIRSVARFRLRVHTLASLWDRNMEPHLLPYLWFMWSWWWCPGWTACYFPLHTSPYSVSSQETWASPYFLRQEHRMFLLFCTRTTTNSVFPTWLISFYEQASSRTLWLKAFPCRPWRPFSCKPCNHCAYRSRGYNYIWTRKWTTNGANWSPN